MASSLSFLERSPRIIGAIGLALLLAGSTFALVLQGGLLTSKYQVTAVFSDAAGIRPGDRVTVAGLAAGSVDGLRIEDGAVHIDLSVHDDVPLPDDSRAEIVIETLLGRSSVALHTGGSRTMLADGGTIPLERTTTPVSIIELNDISVDLLEASDADAFDAFLADLTEITEGKEQDVRKLITGLTRVTGAVNARTKELKRLLTSLRTIAVTLGERDTTIGSLIDDLDVVLGNLAARQDQLRTLLEATASSSSETADLVRRNRATLDALLADLHTDLDVLDDHQLDLAATISYLEQAVRGYSSVGHSTSIPNRWANIFVQSLGPAGVDNLVGQCGLVDQLFDRLFGADCSAAPSSGTPLRPGAGEEETPPAAAVPGAPDLPVPEPALPCGVADVVEGTLGTATGGCGG